MPPAGTGDVNRSLSYLRSFPFDKIKIDRSFIHDMGSNADSRTIARAIIGIGTILGVTITAEGVENESDLIRVKAEGRDEGQGFLFSAARRQSDILDSLQAKTKQVA